jgi:hypothetical protein
VVGCSNNRPVISPAPAPQYSMTEPYMNYNNVRVVSAGGKGRYLASEDPRSNVDLPGDTESWVSTYP